MSDPLDMTGKVVIVTGGSRGVGRGISEVFLSRGADVVICGRKEPEKLPESGGKSTSFARADVREVDQIEAGRQKWNVLEHSTGSHRSH
jgi:NAD(P)-dependent dehydrogenase (short-subunit alcohol dehydrogenase family)